jgi:hypothetical protein
MYRRQAACWPLAADTESATATAISLMGTGSPTGSTFEALRIFIHACSSACSFFTQFTTQKYIGEAALLITVASGSAADVGNAKVHTKVEMWWGSARFRTSLGEWISFGEQVRTCPELRVEHFSKFAVFRLPSTRC